MDELNTDNPIFFTRDENTEKLKIIKKIIKDQCGTTCRFEFDKEYISKCLMNFEFGFILLSRRQATYGTNKGRKDLYNLKAFMLFNYDTLIRTITGRIICAIKTIGDIGNGKRLMDSVFKFGYENKALVWDLSSLPYDKLLKYYESFGFIYNDTIYDRGEKKVYKMSYKFTEENRSIFYEGLSRYKLNSNIHNISMKLSNSPIVMNYETNNDRIIQGMILFIEMFNQTVHNEQLSYTLNLELLNYITEEQIGYISEFETKSKMKITSKSNLDQDDYNKYYDLELKNRNSQFFIMINTELLPDYQDYIEGIQILANFLGYHLNDLEMNDLY